MAGLAAAEGMGEGVQALDGTGDQILVIGNDLLGDVVDAAHGGDDPDLVADGGASYFAESAASGNARIEGQDAALSISVIKNGYLEASSVQAVDEMVDMIVTQRAYEMNSKAITASDEMLQQANNLRS